MLRAMDVARSFGARNALHHGWNNVSVVWRPHAASLGAGTLSMRVVYSAFSHSRWQRSQLPYRHCCQCCTRSWTSTVGVGGRALE